MADKYAGHEQALVRAGWELVDVLGRLGTGPALRAFEARWTAERARAAESLQLLKTGPGVPDGIRAMYEGPSNWTRFRRTLDFVRPGERLFEIGLGRGYLAGMFLRDGQLAAYRGIDLEADNVESTRETLQLNGLADRAEVSQGDLYDLKLADVERFGADLVVCCEVIEHVPDPEAAVKALADALPQGADLLISVPLLGRLEGVWGHLALFDAQRVRSMVTGAGLVPHVVDVVDNTWVFVLASKDEGPSGRAAAATEGPVDLWGDAPVDPQLPRKLRSMDLSTAIPSRWTKRLASSQVTVQDGGLLCEFTGEPADEAASGQYGGAQLPVTEPLGIRLELGLDDIESIHAFYVDAYAGAKRVARWKWEPAKRRPRSNPATFVMRQGSRGKNFVPVHVDDLRSADAFEVFARIEPATHARFRITRASLLTG